MICDMSCWATSAHTPKPVSAMPMPTMPLNAVAAIVIFVCVLKSIRLVRRVCGTMPKAPIISPMEATRTKTVSSSRSKKPAIRGAQRNVTP